MLDPAEFDTLLQFFRAMSDANRLRVVGILSQGPRSVEQLAAELALSPSTVSHHLKRLSDLGVVAATVDGHFHIYALQTERLHSLAALLRQSAPARN